MGKNQQGKNRYQASIHRAERKKSPDGCVYDEKVIEVKGASLKKCKECLDELWRKEE